MTVTKISCGCVRHVRMYTCVHEVLMKFKKKRIETFRMVYGICVNMVQQIGKSDGCMTKWARSRPPNFTLYSTDAFNIVYT